MEGIEILGNVQRDDRGRFIRVDVKIDEVELTIASIYYPINVTNRVRFLQSVGELLEEE